MAHRVSLPRSVITLLAVAALMALTALAAAVARPVPADAASAIVIGNGDVEVLIQAHSALLLGDLPGRALTELVADVAEHHRGALANEQPSDRRSETTCAS